MRSFPIPSIQPTAPAPALTAAWELLYATARRRGAAVDVGRRLPRVCEAAGLRVLDARGSFRLDTSAVSSIESTRKVLEGARRAILGFGLASDADLDTLAQALATAQEQEFRRVVLGHLTVQVIAEVP